MIGLENGKKDSFEDFLTQVYFFFCFILPLMAIGVYLLVGFVIACSVDEKVGLSFGGWILWILTWASRT